MDDHRQKNLKSAAWIVMTLCLSGLAFYGCARPLSPVKIRTFAREKQSVFDYKENIRVPRDHPTIQAAIDAAKPGYRIEVFPGEYHEQLVMKEGIILMSHVGEDGNELVAGPGRFPVLKRAERTVLSGDGFPWGAEARPMVLFPSGTSSQTILDGFTITGMPLISPSRPDHPHVLECGGASPIIRNNIIYENGAAGLGSYAVFKDRDAPMASRDFRFENVIWQSRPIIAENVFYENLFGGIHADFYSQAVISKNEIFQNRSRGEFPGPGIGVQNGASPYIKENLVHDNDWGGIGCRKGKPLGKFPVDLPTLPKIVGNEVYGNGRVGKKVSQAGKKAYWAGKRDYRAGIGLEEVGTQEKAVLVENNLVYRNFAPGISVRKKSVVLIKNNYASDNVDGGIGLESASGRIIGNTLKNNSKAGIGIREGQDLIIKNNLVTNNKMTGIGIESVSNVLLVANRVSDNGMSGFWEVIWELFGVDTGGVGIRVKKSHKIIIMGNRIENNQKPGITITEESTEILLEDNYVKGNGLSDKSNLSIIKGSKVALRNNTLLNSARSNLAVERSVAIITGNLIKNSFEPGIYLSENPLVELKGNRIYDSGTHGITVNLSKGFIIGNTIENSRKYGILFGRNVHMEVKENLITKSGEGKIAGSGSRRGGPMINPK